MFKTPPDKTWAPATVLEYLGFRSYRIKATDGAVYVRSLFHLKPYKPSAQPKLAPPALSAEPVLRTSSHAHRAPNRLDL